MSQSITSRRGTTRRRRRASRIGSPPVRRLPRSVRRMSMRSPRRPPLIAARAALGRGELEPRHQPVELRELVAARARRSASRAAAPRRSQRQRHARPRAASSVARPTRTRPTRRLPRRTPGSHLCLRRSAGPAPPPAAAATVVGLELDGVGLAPAEDRGEDRVERLELGRVGDEHGARRPVQPPPRDGPHERRARARSRAARSAVTGTPASCSRRLKRARERRQVELRSSRTPNGRSLIARTSCSRPAARTTSWSSLYLSTEPSVRSTAAASSSLDAEQVERGDPVDRLGDPGRLLHVAVAHARHRVGHLHGERLRRALARAGARSRPRAAGSGSRSSGTGSGA